MINGKDIRNSSVENFFDMVYEKESVSLTEVLGWKRNFYSEIEEEKVFRSEDYANQDERIDDAFPGMPSGPRNIIVLKAYKHRAKPISDGGHGETGNEERIAELETMVEGSIYAEYQTKQWWVSG